MYEIIILCFGAWLTGVSKAGFGGGIGMIVVPMFTHFRSARNVIGLMLLLLFSTDVFSLRHYWNRWHRQSVTRLILGSLLGIALASLILKDISDYHLKKVIGGIACLFALLEFLRPYWQRWLGNAEQHVESAFRFKTWQGLLAGLFAGAFSTLAHMGGLVVVMYLLPQRLGNTAFVATTTATYFLLNFIKIPFYYQLDLFSTEILIEAVALLPFIALGVLTGIALNNRVPERLFSRIVLFFLFATGVHLLLG
ncbi:sulfite exporter TauE/SafE family protein [Candidatus Poribacteria bacterium]|nr:sulfite exporter TauE/SafE family protein [Candidatus Poribacteria bacterium]